MKRLAELRNLAGVAQQDIAEYLGVARGTYSRYETGEREPDVDTIIRLADYFNVSIDYLLERRVASVEISNVLFNKPVLKENSALDDELTNINNDAANRLLQLRSERGLTQKEFAKKIKMTQSTIADWENGLMDIDNDSLTKLAGFFKVSVEYLRGGQETPKDFSKSLFNKPVLKQISRTAEGFLSIEKQSLISDYERAPKDVQDNVRALLVPFSDRAVQKAYRDATNKKKNQHRKGQVTTQEYGAWVVKAAIKYSKALEAKIKMADFLSWLDNN
jgi:transcriptional regulator with XRE-family HTH domain